MAEWTTTRLLLPKPARFSLQVPKGGKYRRVTVRDEHKAALIVEHDVPEPEDSDPFETRHFLQLGQGRKTDHPKTKCKFVDSYDLDRVVSYTLYELKGVVEEEAA